MQPIFIFLTTLPAFIFLTVSLNYFASLDLYLSLNLYSLSNLYNQSYNLSQQIYFFFYCRFRENLTYQGEVINRL